MISSPLVAPRLVGRDDECAFLMRRLDATIAQNAASFTVVEGSAGMGKTRLAAEVRRRASELRALPIDTFGLEHVREPYAPFVLGIARAAESAPRALAAALGDIVAALDPDVALHKATRLRAVATALRTILRERPVALFVEDVHWADRASLDLLGFFAVELAATPLFVLVTRRAPEASSEPSHVLPTVAHRVRLAPLADRDIGTLLREALREHGSVGADRLRRITQLAGGNPLFALELLRNAVAGAVDDVPPAIAYPIVRRWESVDRATRDVLSAAAAAGGIEMRVLPKIVDRSEADVEKALERAHRVGLVDLDRASGRWRFPHALTRSAIEATIPARARPRLHRRIGELLEDRADTVEPALLAYHWTFAADSERATRYNEAAGDRGIALHDFTTAQRFFETALSHAHADLATVARLNEKLASAALLDASASHATAAIEAALGAYAALGDDRGVARMELHRSRWAWYAGDPAGVTSAAERALAAAEPFGPSPLLFTIRVRLAQIHQQITNRADRARAELDAAEAMRAHATPADDIKFLNARGMLRAAEWDLDGFVRDYEDAVAIAKRVDNVELLVSTQNNLALNAQLTGLPDVALPALEAHIATAYEFGMRSHVPNGLLSLARVRFVFGDAQGAAVALRDALASAYEARRLDTWVGAYGIPIALAAGDRELLLRTEGAADLDTVLASGDAWAIALLTCAHAELAHARDEDARACEVVTRGLAALGSAGHPLELCLAVARFGREDDFGRARALLDAPDRDRARLAERAAFDAHVAARRRRRTEAAQLALRAAELYRGLRWTVLQARCLELAGRASEALRLYRAGGFTRDVGRLAASRGAADPLAPLTPREREIARLVLAGRSNREAGAALGLSERTVGNHLQSVFNRLGIGSRRELADYVAAVSE